MSHCHITFLIIDCLKDYLGYDYRGPLSQSLTKKQCLPWENLTFVSLGYNGSVTLSDDPKVELYDNEMNYWYRRREYENAIFRDSLMLK